MSALHECRVNEKKKEKSTDVLSFMPKIYRFLYKTHLNTEKDRDVKCASHKLITLSRASAALPVGVVIGFCLHGCCAKEYGKDGLFSVSDFHCMQGDTSLITHTCCVVTINTKKKQNLRTAMHI